MGRSRSRSRSRERRRKSRSRSPDRRRDRSRGRDRGGRDRDRDRDRGGRRRSRESTSRSRSPLERRRSRSRDRSHRDHKDDHKKRRDSPRRKDKKGERPIDLQSVANAEQDLMASMGFAGFDTTKNKKVEGNYEGTSKVNKQRRYRQYMNRKGGFNRPLEYMA